MLPSGSVVAVILSKTLTPKEQIVCLFSQDYFLNDLFDITSSKSIHEIGLVNMVIYHITVEIKVMRLVYCISECCI